MKTKVNIQELVDSVKNSQDEKQQRKLEAIQKRYKWLQKYSEDKEVTTVARIPVIPSTITTTYEVEKRKTWKLGNSKTIDCGTETVEHEVKDKVITEEDIITSLKAIHPNHVENTLYWYDNGKYLFTTDRDKIYNLKSVPRPLTKEEQDTINNLVNEVLENKTEADSIIRKARIAVIHNTNDEELTIEDRELKQQTLGEYTLYCFDMEREIKKRMKYHNLGDNKDLNIYGRTITEDIIHTVTLEAKNAKKEHLTMVDSALNKINSIMNQCHEEPLYYLHPLKQNNQIKIYMGERLQNKYKSLGYKVYEAEREYKTKNMTSRNGEIVEEEREYTKTSYYVQMSCKAFKSCCYQGKVCRKGYYYDNQGNEVELGRRPTEAVTITDEKGNSYTFNSKSEAAKELKVSQSLITKAIKNGGVLNLNNSKDNKKSIKLLKADNTVIECATLTELAKNLNTKVYKISRAMKGKTNGDLVTIGDNTYTVVG